MYPKLGRLEFLLSQVNVGAWPFASICCFDFTTSEYLSGCSVFYRVVYLVGLVLRSEEIGAAVEAWPVGLFGLVCINFHFLFVDYFTTALFWNACVDLIDVYSRCLTGVLHDVAPNLWSNYIYPYALIFYTLSNTISNLVQGRKLRNFL